ncbi:MULTISPECIES: GLPGLI family protein [unclassified Chryseobacterium]|uniref:GLPGLI family protein n=1 Tax=unclassified Chryseobacterium TaxID=2593645 RepID=UPI0009112E9A|nr:MULTISPECIES: GLPGLI family protein [unclassified Chryseobacterium]SHG08479.1 GLPGLI family protein [Chryseobacterium sp. OV279]HCA09919.1 GLPGLI family protein [Chryseobacterium sp.]
MKKVITLFILLLTLSVCAQSQRFIYEYKFSIDSTARDVQETEIMFLDVIPKGSNFYSSDVFKSDSIWAAAMDMHVKRGIETDFSKIKFKGKIRYSVEKSYPDYSVIFFNSLGIDRYMVEERRKQKWKILPDKAKIGELAAQKAVCEFAGRKWTAWFTTDLLIQDGPYKFYGLPGLIVKLEDSSQTHSFELKGIKKLPEGYEWKNSGENGFNLIKLNETKYKQAFKDYCKDPMKSEKLMQAQSRDVLEIDDSGKLVKTSNAKRKEREMQLINQIKKENNILELDLLK